MVSVRVYDNLEDLSADLRTIATTAKPQLRRIVQGNVRGGTLLAQRFAQGLAGPHGSSYHKRITGEMTGPLEGEYGPHDGGVPVGGGWRHAVPNTELERSQDLVGPKMAKDVDGLVDRLFWP